MLGWCYQMKPWFFCNEWGINGMQTPCYGRFSGEQCSNLQFQDKSYCDGLLLSIGAIVFQVYQEMKDVQMSLRGAIFQGLYPG